MDYSWVVIGVVNGPFAFLLLAAFFAVLLWKLLRRKRTAAEYRGVFLLGLLYSAVRTAYVLLRMDDYSVSANVVQWSAADLALGFLGAFACSAGGLMVMRDARTAAMRAAGLALSVLPEFLLTAFYFVFITVTNLIYASNPSTPAGIWNYRAFWLPCIALVFEGFLFVVFYRTTAVPQADSTRAAPR
jgi:hypothetical protein